jgi:hypothetical protein
MSDLLKQSIADAKAVRETALANAKSFLEENFASNMKQMFADKLAEDMTVDTEEESVEDSDTFVDDETSEVSVSNEASCDTSTDESVEVVDEELEATEESVEETVENVDESEEVSITNEELDEILSELSSDAETVEETVEDSVEESVEDSVEESVEETIDEEVDLDEILMELEKDMSEMKEDGLVSETEYSDEDGVEIEDEIEDDEEDDEEDEDEIEIEEMADALVAINEENDKLKSELSEHIKTVKYLKGVLSETNLLNAKLLYTNKLFKGRSLSESQKMKVIDTFDLTKSIREVKLAYSVLAESFSSGVSVANKKTNATAQSITEGLASKAVKSTKPDLIVETKVNDMAQRFQKLAGIVK